MSNKLNSESTVQDFIDFFEPIPEDEWCVDVFRARDGSCRKCARGHVGEETEADERMLNLCGWEVVQANNAQCKFFLPSHEREQGIKARVLAYLKTLLPQKQTLPSLEAMKKTAKKQVHVSV